MAFVQIGQTNFSACLAFTKGIKKRQFILDSDADAASLPACDPGSTAATADGVHTYVVNASGAWVKTTKAIVSEGIVIIDNGSGHPVINTQ